MATTAIRNILAAIDVSCSGAVDDKVGSKPRDARSNGWPVCKVGVVTIELKDLPCFGLGGDERTAQLAGCAGDYYATFDVQARLRLSCANSPLDRPDDTIFEQMYVHDLGGVMPITAYVHPT